MAKFLKIILFLAVVMAALVVLVNYFFGDVFSPQGGIYLSSDKGEIWRRSGQASQGNLVRLDVTEIEYNPKDERIMYLGTIGSGVFKSVDGGKSWIKLDDKKNVLSARASVYDVGIDYTLPDYKRNIPDRFYLAVFQNDYGRILKTDDGGSTFKEVYVSSKVKSAVFVVEVDPVRHNVVWGGTADGMLIKSQDYGETWKIAQEFGGAINSLIINPQNTSQFFVSTSRNGIFTSPDGGVTWIDESDSLKNYPKARNVEVAVRDPYSGNIYLATWFGLLKSFDGGISWNPVEIVFPNDALPVLDVAFGSQKAIYVSAKNYIYSTEDGGDFWKVRKLGASRSVRSLVVDPKNGSRIFAGLGK